MKKKYLALAVAALFAGSAYAGGNGGNIAGSASASSTSNTAAAVAISGEGAGVAGAVDKSGAEATSASFGHIQINHAQAHSFGASGAALNMKSGSGLAAAGEQSHAEAKAGNKDRRSWGFRGGQWGYGD